MSPFVGAAVALLSEVTGTTPKEVAALLREPPSPELGDITYPCFALARARGEDPTKVAEWLAKALNVRLGKE